MHAHRRRRSTLQHAFDGTAVVLSTRERLRRNDFRAVVVDRCPRGKVD
jgi:hypothetical protein